MVQKLIRLLLLCVFMVTLSIATPVSAQEAVGITIVPPKLELFSNPGDTINESIRVKNVSGLPQTYSIVVEDFRSSGEEGQVVLEETETNAYSLQSWIKLSAPAIVVQPNEEVLFPFAINVPKDAEPGGHYASILFQIGSLDPIPGVTSVRSRIGALILLRTSGDVKEDANIESFDAPVYQQRGPVEFSLRVKNNGTTHIRPGGTVVVTNIFGKKVAELPLSALNVFPGSVRKMNTLWEKENLFGMYTATLVATYGQQNLPLTASIKFTVASYTGIGLLVLGVIAGYFFIISLVQGRGRLRQALKVILTGK
ncbi:hypothetical protein A3B57_02760 [Microgenomates group bacterium RIFCSPLOWO2_01_FULL_47_10]|nr:MAG: hypothetical protein A3B57_02760 [Microgenomates group bacterium RIFCSPLOWO2_01_FULL_47_10]